MVTEWIGATLTEWIAPALENGALAGLSGDAAAYAALAWSAAFVIGLALGLGPDRPRRR